MHQPICSATKECSALRASLTAAVRHAGHLPPEHANPIRMCILGAMETLASCSFHHGCGETLFESPFIETAEGRIG